MKTAFATGSVSLRELARQMNIPPGTVLSRAKREGWTRQIESAKALAKREETSTVVTPVQAVALSMQQRGERHLGRMANIVEKTVPHVEAMEQAQSSTELMMSKRSTRSGAAPLAFRMQNMIRRNGRSTFRF